MIDKEAILKTEFNEKFIERMKMHMIEGFYKYGFIKKNFEYLNTGMTPALAHARYCLKNYEETRHTDWLVDAACYLMIEHLYPSLQNAITDPAKDKKLAFMEKVAEVKSDQNS